MQKRKGDFTTWTQIKSYALGELGLKPAEFYSMTWDEYCYAAHGYHIRHCRFLEGVRVLYGAIYWANSDGKKGVRTLEQLMPLPTDKKISKRKQAKDAAESLRRSLDYLNVLNGAGKSQS